MDAQGGNVSVNAQGNSIANASASIPLPAGMVAHFAVTVAPQGWLIADGATVLRATYQSLFNAIGTVYGAGDGTTTFKIPDLRGYFIRSLDVNAGVDGGRTLSATPQQDSFKDHVHFYGIPTGNTYAPYLGCNTNGFYGLDTQIYTGGSTTGGGETRPKNMALLACIKY
jgi:phage-related tail fiber protein